MFLKRDFFALLFFFLMIFYISPDGHAQDLNAPDITTNKNSQMCFRWAILLDEGNNELKSLDLVNVISLVEGNRIKFFIEPVNNVYVYLFHCVIDTEYAAEKDISVLFPEEFSFFENLLYYNTQTYVPRGDNSYKVTKPNNDRIYLIASVTRQTKLEDLVNKYRNMGNGNIKKKKYALIDVLNYINGFIHNYSDVEYAKKAIAFTGTMKGEELHCTEITCEAFYIRKIDIVHTHTHTSNQ